MKNDGHIGEEIKETTRHLKDDARDAASAVRDDLEEVARRAGSHVREFADSAEHGLKDAGGAVATKIRENPIQSSLLALGMGLVVGMLYRR